MTRILITGSRHWTDVGAIRDALLMAITEHPAPIVVVHGGAQGADRIAGAIATGLADKNHGWAPEVTTETWYAQWWAPCRSTCAPGHRRTGSRGDYCPAAGNYRNQDMVNAGADLCLAFPLGESTGTRDCMRRAAAAGILVIDHDPDRTAAARPDAAGG